MKKAIYVVVTCAVACGASLLTWRLSSKDVDDEAARTLWVWCSTWQHELQREADNYEAYARRFSTFETPQASRMLGLGATWKERSIALGRVSHELLLCMSARPVVAPLQLLLSIEIENGREAGTFSDEPARVARGVRELSLVANTIDRLRLWP